MDWEAIGAIGEILGAGAVVFSLIYLATQIRNQNREARAAATHEIAEGIRDAQSSFVDADTAQLFVRANEKFDDLTPAERVQIIAAHQRLLRLWEEAYYQYIDGRLDTHLWNVLVRQFSAYLSAKSMARVWALRREYFDERFCEFVDGIQKRPYEI